MKPETTEHGQTKQNLLKKFSIRQQQATTSAPTNKNPPPSDDHSRQLPQQNNKPLIQTNDQIDALMQQITDLILNKP
ncbi:hypothetical protein [Synechococcus sp. MIT S1220]|uniref:hypothetical protein n=1 Tax=Synechococcus sp. MIT S1220 TaxID=3082549 RepID=UPI0039AFF29D